MKSGNNTKYKTLGLLSLLYFNLLAQDIWLPLSTGVTHSSFLPKVTAMTIWNNKLVVGGAFTSAGGNITNNVAAWDGANWSTLSTGLKNITLDIDQCFSFLGGVSSLAVYQGSLIAAGNINSTGSNTFVSAAKWTGSTWVGIINKLTATDQTPAIRVMIVYNNKLIVAGIFDSINNIPAKNIAQWNGNTWSALGTGIINDPVNGAGFRGVYGLEVYNNELYAGGTFSFTVATQTVNNIAKWNGSNWSALGNGIPYCFPASGNTCKLGSVGCLKVYNNELYVANCNSGVSKWNGSAWSSVGGGMNTLVNEIYSMHVFDNKLVLAGKITQIGSIFPGSIVAWDGANWLTFGNPLSSGIVPIGTGEIYSLMTYNNSLYVGGYFSYAQSNTSIPITTLNNITKFSGNIISVNEHNLESEVKTFPNPSTGQFTVEGLTENCSVEVTDLTGRIIHSQKLCESDNTINLQDKQKGIYIYKIKTKEDRVQQGKLILE